MLSVIFDNSFCAYRTYKRFELCEKTKGSAFSERSHFYKFTFDFSIYPTRNIDTVFGWFDIDSSLRSEWRVVFRHIERKRNIYINKANKIQSNTADSSPFGSEWRNAILSKISYLRVRLLCSTPLSRKSAGRTENDSVILSVAKYLLCEANSRRFRVSFCCHGKISFHKNQRFFIQKLI